ncbi:hypothetical protein DFH27DRAFT_627287 [Peziza echinospora]|nr:hypothetical protein DFH27DRAFT_627287 [Peziza echinospora]
MTMQPAEFGSEWEKNCTEYSAYKRSIHIARHDSQQHPSSEEDTNSWSVKLKLGKVSEGVTFTITEVKQLQHKPDNGGWNCISVLGLQTSLHTQLTLIVHRGGFMCQSLSSTNITGSGPGPSFEFTFQIEGILNGTTKTVTGCITISTPDWGITARPDFTNATYVLAYFRGMREWRLTYLWVPNLLLELDMGFQAFNRRMSEVSVTALPSECNVGARPGVCINAQDMSSPDLPPIFSIVTFEMELERLLVWLPVAACMHDAFQNEKKNSIPEYGNETTRAHHEIHLTRT